MDTKTLTTLNMDGLSDPDGAKRVRTEGSADPFACNGQWVFVPDEEVESGDTVEGTYDKTIKNPVVSWDGGRLGIDQDAPGPGRFPETSGDMKPSCYDKVRVSKAQKARVWSVAS